MIRQNPEMQHLGIGDQDIGGIFADFSALIVRSVAIIKGHCGAGLARPVNGQPFKGLLLILSQSLQREKIESCRLRIAQVTLEKGQVVDQRLAAGRGRGHDNVAAGADDVHGQGLMGIKGLHASGIKHVLHGAGPGTACFPVFRRFGFHDPVAGHLILQTGRRKQRFDVIFHCGHAGTIQTRHGHRKKLGGKRAGLCDGHLPAGRKRQLAVKSVMVLPLDTVGEPL